VKRSIWPVKDRLTVPGAKAPNAKAAKKKGKPSSPGVFVELDLGNSNFDINSLFPSENESIGSYVYHADIVAPKRQHDPYRVMRSGAARRRSLPLAAIARTLVAVPVRLAVGLVGVVAGAAQPVSAKAIRTPKPLGFNKPAFLSAMRQRQGTLPSWLVPAGATLAVASLSTMLWLNMSPTRGPVVDQILAQNGTAKLAEAQKLAAQPGIVNAARTRIVEYTVKAGDSVSTLASRFQLNEATIRQANGLMPDSKLKAGKTLTILPVNGVLHKLGRGETAFELAYRYGVSVAKLQEANRNISLEHLQIGQTLVIPGVSAAKERAQPAVVRRHASEPVRVAALETRRSDRAGRRPDRGSRSERRTPVSRSLGAGERERPAVAAGRMLVPNGGYVSSGFGWRGHGFHSGLDIANDPGTTIRAARDGVVVSADYDGAYGNAVVISHGNGLATRYAHCSRLLVSPGQRVEAGQPIGAVGTTGRATGPHVHFEVRVNGSAVDPRGYL
jgi:murein DD-endopeptidase MepM/ murein hydrolase activator NlpD